MMNKNIYKNEKGSITLFVLMCMMFICLILLGFYLSSINSNNAQLKEIQSIKEQYTSQEDINDIYLRTVNNAN